MWKWWQIGAVAGLCGLLAACGGGGGTDDGSTIPARAGEAEIGTAGGTVDAVLEGGTTLRIDIPADALKAQAALRIEPLAAQPGEFGGFRVTPADLALRKPVKIVLTWADGQPVPKDLGLAMRRGAELVPISPSMQGTQLVFELANLGSLPAALSEAAATPQGRSRLSLASPGTTRRPAADGVSESEMVWVLNEGSLAVRIEYLRGYVNSAIGLGTGTSEMALDIQRIMDSIVYDPAADLSNQRLIDTALTWRPFLCAQYASVRSALDTYEGTASVVFIQRARAVLRWGMAVRDFGRAAARLSPALGGCGNAPEDYRQPVLDKLPAFLERVETAVQNVPFVQLIDDEMPPLIRVEEMLRLVDADGHVLPTLQRLGDRLRSMAYESCRTGAGQDDHQLLLARATGDAGFAAVTGYTPPDVRDDIQRCGIRLVAEALDSNGAPVATAHSLGVNATERQVTMAGAASLRLTAEARLLRALQCPSGGSANNEQLVVEGGPAPGNMTELSRISPSNAATYLESPQALSFTREALHALRNPATEETLLRIRRDGGLCSGAFANLNEHAVLVELRLGFRDDLSGTWVGTITATSEFLDVGAREQAGLHGWLGFRSNRSMRLQATYQVAVDIVAGRTTRFTVSSVSGGFVFNHLSASRLEQVRDPVGVGCVYFETEQRTETGTAALTADAQAGSLRIEPDGRYTLTYAPLPQPDLLLRTRIELLTSRGTIGAAPPCMGDFVNERTHTLEGQASASAPGLEHAGAVEAGVIRGAATHSRPGASAGQTYRVSMTWDLRRQ